MRIILLGLIALLLILWLALQTSFVQNWIIGQLTRKLSKDLHTTVSIKKVDFDLFNQFLVEGLLIKDLQLDTLAYAGSVSIKVNNWFFLKDKINIKQLEVEKSFVHLWRKDSVWNSQFLLDYFGKDTTSQPSNLKFDLGKVYMTQCRFLIEDQWKGQDQDIRLGRVQLLTDSFLMDRKKIQLKELNINRPYYSLSSYQGFRPDSLVPVTIPYKDKPSNEHLRWNPTHWDIGIEQFQLENGTVKILIDHAKEEPGYFNGSDIHFYDFNTYLKKVRVVNDSVLAQLKLSTREKSGFRIKELTANIRFHPQAMEFRQMDFITPYSHLRSYYAMRFNNWDDLAEYNTKVVMEGEFRDASIHTRDLAYFAPALSPIQQLIRMNGSVKGTVSNLSSDKIELKTGNNSVFRGNFYMKGLPELEATHFKLNADELSSSYADVIAMAPALKTVKTPRLDRLEFLNFNGSLSGFFNSFVTYGTLETKLGNLIADLNIRFPKEGGLNFGGNLRSPRAELGSFLDIPQMGHISFDSELDGNLDKNNRLGSHVQTQVDEFEFLGYTYKNLDIDGLFAKQQFRGKFQSVDSNFKVGLEGLVDLSKNIPYFDIKSIIENADLNALKISSKQITLKGLLEANFSGSSIDNFEGRASITNASLYNGKNRLPFDSLVLDAQQIEKTKIINLNSNQLDAILAGEFNILNLPDAFQTFLHKYYPSYIPAANKMAFNQNFSFVISTRNINDFFGLTDWPVAGFDNSTVSGRINSLENQLDLNVDVPAFNYGDFQFSRLSLKGEGNLSKLGMTAGIGDLHFNDSLHFPGTKITLTASGDSSEIMVNTSANQTLNSANLAASVYTRRDGLKIVMHESNFDLSGKSWIIDENGLLDLGRELVNAEGLRIYNGQQAILITSTPSDIRNTNDLKIDLQKLNLGDFSPYFISSNRLEGLLTGTVYIADPLGNTEVETNLLADQFRLDNDSLGTLELESQYKQSKKLVSFAGHSNNQWYDFDVAGKYDWSDSTQEPQLDLNIDFEKTKIDLLKQYLTGIFKEITGLGTGKLRIHGPVSQLDYTGEAHLEKAKATVDFTNVSYFIPSAHLVFKPDRIDFGSFMIQDSIGNTGFLSRGIMKHKSFDQMEFDFALNTNKLLVMNTTNQSSDPFYGTVIAKANLNFSGPLENMVMNIKGQPADSSEFFIRSSEGRESGQADFIVWKTYGKEMQQEATSKSSKLTMNLDITANSLVKMNVIIDELTNDVMSANGHGNLRMKATTNGEFSMTGQYDIDAGDYNFNFQSLLRKPFKLKGDAGSYIRWNGDPFDAEMKVAAVYEADNVKFSDLGDRLYLQTGGDVEYIKKFRGKVKVTANLTGKLMQPDIQFALEMPDGSPLKNDPLVVNLLRQIENDKNELNKQVAFLIIFNSFGPMSTSSQAGLGSQAVEGIVTNGISGFISSALNKQFSGIVQKLFNDQSIKVNFNAQFYNGAYLLNNTNAGAFNIDRTNLNFSVARSLFNERLTFTFGSALDFGFTPAQAQSTNNLQFLPDIATEWKLRPDGKLLLTFFYRDSYNYQSANGKQNRSGAGISYRKDFEKLGDLWRNDRKKKKLDPESPAPSEGNQNSGGN